MMQVLTYNSIHQIDPETWDSLSPGNWFHQHRFVASVEEANMPGAQYWYLLFRDHNRVVGNCILSTCDISLDLFLSENNFARLIRKLFPKIFKIKLLMCGLPASFGQINAHSVDPRFTDQIVEKIALELEQIAQQAGINFICVKELLNGDRSQWKSFARHGFFLANSIPYMKLHVHWSSFSDYMDELRHPYRRSIRRSLQKIRQDEPLIYDSGQAPLHTALPVLVVGDISLCPPQQLYSMYRAVMERATTKLEILTPEFFHSLYKNMGNDLKLLVLKKGDTIFSAALLLLKEQQLTFMLVGREKASDEYDSYFNLVYGILALAIQWKVSEIKLGQTAYWVKQRIGAIAEDQFFFFQARKSVVHAILARLNRFLFPAFQLPAISVFKHPVDQPQLVCSSEFIRHTRP